jgi:hypothetical protein
MDKLKEVDLQDVSHSLVKTYSGGMKRYYIWFNVLKDDYLWLLQV